MDYYAEAVTDAIEKGQYGAATNLYFQLLSSESAARNIDVIISNIESNLSHCISELARGLASGDFPAKGLWLYSTAISLTQGKSKLILFSYAKYICAIQSPDTSLLDAINALEQCLTLDPNFSPARESLESIKGLVVDRWHFRMLNDCDRNTAYKYAIEEAVRKHPDCTILDIGGGNGLD